MSDSRADLTKSAAYASIATALLLVGLKVWATWRTGSMAMLGSLADTTLDLIASIATLIGVWIAAQPADHMPLPGQQSQCCDHGDDRDNDAFFCAPSV